MQQFTEAIFSYLNVSKNIEKLHRNNRLLQSFSNLRLKKKKYIFIYFLLIYSLLLPKGEQNPPQGGDPRVSQKLLTNIKKLIDKEKNFLKIGIGITYWVT